MAFPFVHSMFYLLLLIVVIVVPVLVKVIFLNILSEDSISMLFFFLSRISNKRKSRRGNPNNRAQSNRFFLSSLCCSSSKIKVKSFCWSVELQRNIIISNWERRWREDRVEFLLLLLLLSRWFFDERISLFEFWRWKENSLSRTEWGSFLFSSFVLTKK